MDRFESEAKKTDGFCWFEPIFSHRKMGPVLLVSLGSNIGDEIFPTQLYRDYFQPWNKDPGINQPGFNGK